MHTNGLLCLKYRVASFFVRENVLSPNPPPLLCFVPVVVSHTAGRKRTLGISEDFLVGQMDPPQMHCSGSPTQRLDNCLSLCLQQLGMRRERWTGQTT